MTTLAALTCALILAPQQEAPLFPVPAEFKKADFLVGNWKSEGEAMGMGGAPTKIMGDLTVKVSMDRWFELDSKDTMEGIGTTTGKFMITYNDEKGSWEGILFDSVSNYSLKTTGTFADGALTLVSDEIVLGGNTMTFRFTMKKVSDTEFQNIVDVKMGDEFTNFLTHNYKK